MAKNLISGPILARLAQIWSQKIFVSYHDRTQFQGKLFLIGIHSM